MQVTVSFLPVSLSLVRIPRSRLPKLFHPLLRQILNPNPSFLNITCNELELSIFADSDILEDFELIARKDRQKKKLSRSRSTSRGTPSKADDYEYVEISYDTWNVLQIDSHSDGLDNSGARIHEFSAPLAAAGISILYLSSYMSDFIFVKSTRLQGVVSLLAAAGFDLYSSGSAHMISQVSPLISPVSPDDVSPVRDLSPEGTSTRAVTRSRSGTESSLTSILLGTSTKDLSGSSGEEDIPAARSKSHSPSASQVTVLGPDLTCVGLSDDNADIWALKIIKLVAFPGLISTSPQSRKNSPFASPPHSQPRSPTFEFNACPSNGILTPSDSSGDEDDDEPFNPPPHRAPVDPPPTGLRSTPKLSMTQLGPITVQKSSSRSSHPRTRNSDTEDYVPFYSFTRTSEGSSLTTDVQLLAALFPPNERHMVICRDELDNVESDDPPGGGTEIEKGDEPAQLSGTLKCLQIDLRNFGLDKHGLVHRYSQVLQENGINHMYSSTFKTANLLVDKTHARRAQELLRSC